MTIFVICVGSSLLSKATDVKHLISSEISKICISGGERYIGKFFEFFNFLDSFHTKLAKMTHNGKFFQKSQLDWLKMANFGHFVGFSP